MNILLYFVHPRTDRSQTNIHLMKTAQSVKGVTIVDLYAEYPTFDIDVELEQKRLRDHDVIIFQHPFYWYSAPALLKEWQDLVLEHGFAYGHNATALKGKIAFHAITSGGSREAYSAEGALGLEIRDLLMPFQKTLELCHMQYLAPFMLYGAAGAGADGRLPDHLNAFRELLSALIDNRIDMKAAQKAHNLSDNPSTFLTREGAR